MSLLDEHFERVRLAESEGIKVIRGIFLDVGNTLIDKDGSLLDASKFAVWNAENQLFPNQVIFSDAPPLVDLYVEEYGIKSSQIGLSDLKDLRIKEDVFLEAVNAKLELIIDDKPPLHRMDRV